MVFTYAEIRSIIYMSTCDYNFKYGWWCSREKKHDGPCALRPKWWNLTRFAREYRKFERELGK